MKPAMKVTVSSLLVALFVAASWSAVVSAAAEGQLTGCPVDEKQLEACKSGAKGEGDVHKNINACCNHLLDNTDTCLQCAVDELFPEGSDVRTACFKQDVTCPSAQLIRLVSA